MRTAWHGAKLLLPLSLLFGAAYSSGQDGVARTAQVAALHPLPGLVWKRTSPTLGKPDGPVLYQLIFRSNATPNAIPMISPQFTLTNSPIQVNAAGDVVIGGLSINATSGIVTFASGQQLNSGGPFVDLSSDQTIAGIKTFGSTINGNISGSAGMLGGQLPSFYQARVSGNCTPGSAVLAVNADGSVLCAGPFFDLSSDQTIGGIKTFSQLIQGSVSGSAALLGGQPPSFYQAAVTGNCPAGAIQGINANGSVNCSGASVDLTSDQTIGGVKTFTSVINGSISGSAAMLGGQAASFYQAKVTGSCPLGSAVIAVNGDGSVSCGPATNLFASASNLLTLLDGNARQASNAITIGADGMPIIVYNGSTFDVNNVLQPNLSLVHCTSVDCSTHA